MKIIFAGTIGRSGLGGQAWASLQYLLGFRALGHEVFYLEDCGDCSWVYNWDKEEWTFELEYPAAYVRECLEPFGLGDRWIYRTNGGSAGAPLEEFLAFCAEADLLVMRAVPLWVWRREYDRPRRRIFLDVDPGFTQISIANGDKGLAEGIARCERRFTLGQRVGASDCPIPLVGGPWLKTLPPVFLPEWQFVEIAASHFTSLMRWQGFREATYLGVSYGQRDKEFPDVLDLPRLTPQKFCIAQMGIDPDLLKSHGWEVAPGEIVSRTPGTYRAFIQNSRAEFSVPKNGYVRMRGGWFSDRSVCYLATGRPVLIKDTGLTDWLPVGEGLLTFEDQDGAAAGVNRINQAYERHRRAARRLAENVFSTDRVLPALLGTAVN
ncbi:MAG: glycosyltransferase family 1 protein [Verrucomicrobia bacterium]|nr:MAG: glycosyltransferase family 1 protein [Verrucomicrobiota bacterium]